ncbi:DEKNAAC104617 [Brettanomyces naardenensis]|uniref:FACT complex subunit POB3 n=1 Tax=Brettanomyces naardenensis TaxID=13370 RepID=A0A448YRA2_BRENA|nr:DEKNAAC104617 [Brettanomyces naardenensis]
MSTEYERIYLNQSKLPGRMRIADSGLGWKAQAVPGSTVKTAPFLLPSEEISTTLWSRGSRGYELRIDTKNRGVVMLDGFSKEDLTSLKNEFEKYFDMQLELREHSLRGWNWGKTQLARNELVFNVSNKPAFEIPYSEIGNTNMTGKNEVSVEINLVPKDGVEKAGDELVDIKFFLPGNMEQGEEDEFGKKEESKEKAEGDEENGDKVEPPKTKALFFYDELKDKADLGQVAGEMIVSFGEILFLTPRGRYDIDMYDSFLRLRGKTYDYKIQYKQVQRIFSLPKVDGLRQLMILQVDPPLRQGQTKYSFLILQFDTQEEIEVELNIDDEEYEKNWKTKLNKTYSNLTYLVLANIFKGFTERRIVQPGSFLSKDSEVAIGCSVKANEGHLYPLEKCMMFVTKPTILIPYSEVSDIIFSRVDSTGTSKTFDMDVNLKFGGGSHTFGNIDRGQQPLLETFFKSKNLRVKNDEKIAQEVMAAALMDSDGDEDMDMGSADEESPDEDFKPGDEEQQEDEDVDEEFNSEGDDEGDAKDSEGEDEDGEDEDGDDEPEKKKQKN